MFVLDGWFIRLASKECIEAPPSDRAGGFTFGMAPGWGDFSSAVGLEFWAMGKEVAGMGTGA